MIYDGLPLGAVGGIFFVKSGRKGSRVPSKMVETKRPRELARPEANERETNPSQNQALGDRDAKTNTSA